MKLLSALLLALPALAAPVSVTWVDSSPSAPQSTYTLYRAPGYCYSAGAKIAEGLTAMTATDAAPPKGISCYYVEAAEGGRGTRVSAGKIINTVAGGKPLALNFQLK